MKGALRVLALILVGFVVGIWGLRSSTDVPAASSQRGPGGSGAAGGTAEVAGPEQIEGPIVGEAVTPGISPAVRDLPPLAEELPELNREINPRQNPNSLLQGNVPHVYEGIDPLVAHSLNGGQTPALDFDFEATGNPTGCGGCSPPDINGDVGPNHYVHMVNATKVAIYDKAGTLIDGPFNLGTLWSSGNCTSNAGDPIVLYDPLADRWLLSQFANPSHMCVAISQTADPTGSYYTYTFNVGSFPDYFKFGVWPDGYYMSANEATYTAYAFDRVNMLAGQAATFQKFTGGDNFYLPGDIDGPTPPPAGAPNPFYTYKDDSFHGGTDRLELREFDVDWVTPANTTFTLVASPATASYTYTPCGFFNFNCIRQQGTAQRFDAVGEWPLFRFPYRNFGSHQALVGVFVIGGGLGEEGGALRWFELRNTGAGWTLYQEGTYDPGDGHDRVNGSIAMDRAGNMAMGFTVSSSGMKPAIRYTIRLATDPLGTMQSEAVLINGGGAQTGSNRWGDYSAIAVDPANDCSFWYTNEYYPTDASTTWKTRVGVFTIPGCTSADFSLDATPEEQSICAGDPAVYAVEIGSLSGFDDNVTLSAQGHPAGTTANFSPNPVTPPGNSTLTIGNTGAAAAGSYAIDIVGTAPTSTHTTTVGLDVFSSPPGSVTLTAPANGATNVSLVPDYSWTAATQGSTYDLEVATDAGFSNIVYSATVDDTSHTQATPLNALTVYYWHVRANNDCGDGSFSSTFSFTTADIPPILLVDDDDNGPDVQATYTSALDNLGAGYDLWDTANSDNEPALNDLLPYEMVIWFSGDEFGGTAGPGSAGETALASWLDQGNCLFISSQDYHYDRGMTTFMTNYLGAATITDDNGDYASVTGQGSVFSGLGPYTLTYPFNDYSDPITPNGTAELAFQGNNGNGAAINKDSGSYRTTYWVYPWEAISTSAGREEAMQATLDWCGGASIEGPEIDVDPTSDAATLLPNQQVTHTLAISNLGDEDVIWDIEEDDGASRILGGWSDNFDSYATDSQIHGQGGWKGWFNDPNAGAFVRDEQAISTPNSVEIVGSTDLLHEFSGYTSGVWTYTAWQYIPGAFSGTTYVILLNSYDDAGANLNWSTQVNFDSSSDLVVNDGASGGTLALITDEWVEIRVVIDLDNDTQQFYYDDQLLYSGTWTNEVSGGGVLEINAVDLYANAATAVYYDDLSLAGPPSGVCEVPDDIPWLSVSPTAGTTTPGGTTNVNLAYDSTGLAVGIYDGTLCINSNDPDESLVMVPVELTVSATPVYGVDVSTADDDLTGDVGTTVTYTVEVANTGNVADTYDLGVSGNSWTTTPSDTSVTVAAGDSETVLVTVAIPANAGDGDTDAATMTAESQNDPGTTDSVQLTTTANVPPPVFGVTVNTADPDLSGEPGTLVTYTLDIENTGNVTDTYDLEATGQSWTTTPSPTSVTVAAGDSETVLVTVAIPANAGDGDTDTVTITAESQNDPGATDSVALTTTAVVTPVFGVTVDTADADLSGEPGTVVTYTVEIHNTGNVTDSYDLTVAGNSWMTHVDPTSVTVGPGDSETVWVTVHIPDTAGDNDADVVTITATSQTDDGVADSVELTTTAEMSGYTLYLPVAIYTNDD